MEYLRAQPTASSSRLVTNPASPDMSVPLQCAVVPGVEEAHHQNREEDDHLQETRSAQRAIHDGPRIEEDELDVEQDEENGGQVELDRQMADRQRERNLPALERLRFHGRRLFGTERRCKDDVCRNKSSGEDERDHYPEVLMHHRLLALSRRPPPSHLAPAPP